MNNAELNLLILGYMSNGMHLVELMVDFSWVHFSFWTTLGLRLLVQNNHDDNIPSVWVFAFSIISAVRINSIRSLQVTIVIDTFLVTFVYVSVCTLPREACGIFFLHIMAAALNNPWLVLRNFIAILGGHEKY